MRAAFLLPLLLTPAFVVVHAQSPFQFREAYLLEHRIQVERSGQEHDPNHSELGLSTMGPSPAQRRSVQLVGPPNLFATFALPQQLPPISAYTKATFTEGTLVETIDKAGLCESAP